MNRQGLEGPECEARHGWVYGAFRVDILVGQATNRRPRLYGLWPIKSPALLPLPHLTMLVPGSCYMLIVLVLVLLSRACLGSANSR